MTIREYSATQWDDMKEQFEGNINSESGFEEYDHEECEQCGETYWYCQCH